MRVLFASPCPPLPLVDGRDPLDPFTAPRSPARGSYAPTMHGHCWAFYLMAENVDAECCVLEHGTLDEFSGELARGYDFVGLQVSWNTLTQTLRMVERARRVAPGTRIVIGGYALPQLVQPLPPDEETAAAIRREADHLCWQEGVGFMRRLLRDGPFERPVRQYTLPRGRGYLAEVGAEARVTGSRPVLVSLGCAAGCDFCNTSAFFRRRKIPVADPRQIHDFMRHHLLNDGTPRASFELVDEDLFWEPAFSQELGRRLRGDPATLGRVGYFTFATVRSLSRMDPEELVANGLGMVSIGVESTLPDVLRPGARLGKRKGRDLSGLFHDLRDVGIPVVASMILGFDFHTPENVGRDIEQFVRLEPAVPELIPLIPCAGTPLYDRLAEAGRLNPEFGWTRAGAFSTHPPTAPRHMGWSELQDRIREAHEQILLETGPPALKGIDAALRGHLRFRDASDSLLRERARGMGEDAKRQYPVLAAVLAHPPSARVRERARETRERWIKAFGEPDERLVALGQAFAERVRRQTENPSPPPSESHPPARWTYYRPGEPPRVIRRAA